MGTTAITPTTTTATDFATIGRVLTEVAAQHGASAPGFRSPPRIPGVNRSITKNRDSSVTVAITLRDRPVLAVLADMIDGVMLTSGGAPGLYDQLWSAAHDWLLSATPVSGPNLRLAA